MLSFTDFYLYKYRLKFLSAYKNLNLTKSSIFLNRFSLIKFSFPFQTSSISPSPIQRSLTINLPKVKPDRQSRRASLPQKSTPGDNFDKFSVTRLGLGLLDENLRLLIFQMSFGFFKRFFMFCTKLFSDRNLTPLETSKETAKPRVETPKICKSSSEQSPSPKICLSSNPKIGQSSSEQSPVALPSRLSSSCPSLTKIGFERFLISRNW